MKFTVEIDSEGGAFTEREVLLGDELARILRKLADELSGCDAASLNGSTFPLHDYYGNRAGRAVAKF